MLDAAARAGCRKVVFASSSTVYGDPVRQPVHEVDQLHPISPYGASKLAGEHYVRVLAAEHGRSYTILRFGNVFGPRDSPLNNHVITSFAHALLRGRAPVIEWDGEQRKDYVYAGDVAQAVRASLERGGNDIFNIGCERAVSVNELFRLVSSVVGVDMIPERRERRAGDVRNFVMDCSRAHQRLGWHADTPLDDALRITIESMADAHGTDRTLTGLAAH